MSPLKTRKKKGKLINPRTLLVDGINKLIIAKTKRDLVKLYLCYNMGESKESRFDIVSSLPDGEDGIILISAPIPIETAWILYCEFNKWVPLNNLPNNMWKELK